MKQNEDNKVSLLQICLITKEWGGIVMEGLTDADNFGIKWDEDLDVKVTLS